MRDLTGAGKREGEGGGLECFGFKCQHRWPHGLTGLDICIHNENIII